MALVKNSAVTSSSDTVVQMKPIFFGRAPWRLRKMSQCLVALAKQSSQELSDLYRKAANLDVKMVLECGHDNQVQKSYIIVWSVKTNIIIH